MLLCSVYHEIKKILLWFNLRSCPKNCIFFFILLSWIIHCEILHEVPTDSDNNFIVINMYGNISNFGSYFLDIYFGYPPQIQSVIFDTGSSLLAIPCNECQGCRKYHLDPIFDTSASWTLQKIPCDSTRCAGKCDALQCAFDQDYIEGSSIRGFYVSDLISLKGQNAYQLFRYDQIGCIIRETKLFRDQEINGILGFAKFLNNWTENLFSHSSKISGNVNYTESLPSIDRTDSLPQNSTSSFFSLCLSDNGGLLILGNQKWYKSQKIKSMIKGKIEWIDLWNKIPYKFEYIGLIFANKFHSSCLNGGECTSVINIDSGTTLNYLPSHLVKPLRSFIIDHICLKFKVCEVIRISGRNCWSVDEIGRNFNNFPIIKIILLNGKTLAISSKSYLFLHNSSEGHTFWCDTFESYGGNIMVLGLGFIKNQMIIFDATLSKMGVAAADCPTTNLDQRRENHKLYNLSLSGIALTKYFENSEDKIVSMGNRGRFALGLLGWYILCAILFLIFIMMLQIVYELVTGRRISLFYSSYCAINSALGTHRNFIYQDSLNLYEMDGIHECNPDSNAKIFEMITNDDESSSSNDK